MTAVLYAIAYAAFNLAYMLYVGILLYGVYRMIRGAAWLDYVAVGAALSGWLLGTAVHPSASRLITLGCLIAMVLVARWRDRRDAQQVEQGEPSNPFTMR